MIGQRMGTEHRSMAAPQQVFLGHSAEDKPVVRGLCDRLARAGFRPWLDENDLLPGQDWEFEISRALRDSDVILVCLSTASVAKPGYVQKEIRRALSIADEKPEGTIFVIPARLDRCRVPDRLRQWQWVDLFDEAGYSQLIASIKSRDSSCRGILDGPDRKSTRLNSSH